VVEPAETPLPEPEIPAPVPAEAEVVTEEPIDLEPIQELEEEAAEEGEGAEFLAAVTSIPEPLGTGPQIRFAEDILPRSAGTARAGRAKAKTKAKGAKRRKTQTYVEDDSVE